MKPGRSVLRPGLFQETERPIFKTIFLLCTTIVTYVGML
jgi:hypothetical protein